MHKENFFLFGPVGNIKDEGESEFCIWAIILHFAHKCGALFYDSVF